MKTKKKPRLNVTVRRKEKRAGGTTYARPADWLMDILVGDKSTSGVVVNESTALTYAVVFACVRNLSEDLAKLPLILYEKVDGDVREEAVDEPLYDLLMNEPSDEMTSMDFRQAMMVDVLLGGNGYAEIQRNGGGQPVALYKLERNRVTPRRVDGKIVYEYRESNKREPVFIPAENMLHIKGIGDGLVGWSVIKLAKQSIGLALGADATGASFFGNGSLPSGVLQTEEKVSEQAMKNLRESWERVHGGPDNKNKIAILEQGLKFNPMSVSNEDSQFLETRQFSVEDVCRWFRMPPHKVGHLMRATGWSTLEVTNEDYKTDTLQPWATRWEKEISRKLIAKPRRAKFFAQHDFDEMLRADTAARSAYYTSQFNVGSMSQNEIRASEFRNPIAGGDVYYVPLNMVPSEIAAKGPQKDPIPAPAPTDMPKEPSKDPKVKREKIKSVQDAHAGMLEEGLARMLKVEGERAQRHRNKAGFAAWVDSFYVEHQLHVRACVGWSLEAFAAAIWALSADGAMPEAVSGLVRSQIDSAALRHVNLSKLEVEDGEKFEATAERVANQANVELVLMTNLIEKLAGEFK